MGNQLKELNIDIGHFTGRSGKEYYISKTLNVTRYRKLEEFEIEFGYTATFIEIFNNIKKAWELLNSVKLAEAAILLHNIMKGITILEKKDSVTLRICALFINSQDEDITNYDEILMKEKIEDWKDYNITPFFHLAASLVPAWLPAYKVVLNDISQVEKKKKESNTLIK